jgi:putative ABC transport system substrate-binding protein
MGVKMNNRRSLLILLGAAAFNLRAVFAQTKPAVLIGWLNSESRSTSAALGNLAAFKEEMASRGWKEGANYILDERWADGQGDQLPSLAKALAATKPVLIVAANARATVAAAKAAPQIPVVQANGNSPVASGLAASLARPGGMVTGSASITSDLSEKYVELLLAAAPRLRRIGVLADPKSLGHDAFINNVRRSAEHYRVELRFAEVTRAEELDGALARLMNDGVQGLVVLPSSLFGAERARIIKFALSQRWPHISNSSRAVEEGALLSYSIDGEANYRRAAYYVDRILKGARPADLPIEQPMVIRMYVNLKTAKLLGLTMPPDIMVRATRVIQ